MIDVVGERGYSGTTVTELRSRAGVSKRTIYDEFSSKEGLFLSTYDIVISRILKDVQLAYRRGSTWEARVRSAFDALLEYIESNRSASRLVFLDAFSVGRPAIARAERAARMFESRLSASFADAPEETNMPRFVTKAIVGGTWHLVQLSLISDEFDDRRAPNGGRMDSDALAGWVSGYRSAAVLELVAKFGPPHEPRPPNFTELDECPDASHIQTRLQQAAISLVSERGYENVTVAGVIERAGVADNDFFDVFMSVEECVLSAAQSRMQQTLTRAACGTECDDGPAAVQVIIERLLVDLANDAALTQVAFVELRMSGYQGLLQQGAWIEQIAAYLEGAMPSDSRPARQVTCAVAGGIWEVLRRCVVLGQARRLPEISGLCSYLALAPAIGAAQATREIRRRAEHALVTA